MALRARTMALQPHRIRLEHALSAVCLPHGQPLHRPHLQMRSYYYFPVSLEEFKERFLRWIERAEQRLVKVKLLSHKARQLRIHQGRRQFSRFVGRTQTNWDSWFHQRRKESLPLDEPPAHSVLSKPLPLPYTDTDDNEFIEPKTMRARYLGWKSRRKEQYQGWKSRRKEQYQSWKSRRKDQFQSWKIRRQEQYRGWKLRRQLDWIRTKQIVLNEYSRPEWFDEMGRPLTSKDSIGRYVNPWQSQSTNGLHSVGTILKWRWQRFCRGFSQVGGSGSILPKLSWTTPTVTMNTASQPQPLPRVDNGVLSMTWVGHSTCWIQIQGFTMLTDPIFSLRSSPYQALPIGVARETPPSHSIEELVHHSGGMIDFCCVTHDHYDHMDRDSVRQLSPFVHKWIVPIGIGPWLVEKAGVKKESIVELEWWQQRSFSKTTTGPCQVDGLKNLEETFLTITCCPASHWASRTMFDRNHRLWCSFAVESPLYRLFFCGDTGYPDTFPLFRQIADALGPFDLSCIPIGAYEPSDLNKDAHVNPNEAIQIHKDLMSRHSIGIHWGTFSLGEEPMDEPPMALLASMQSERMELPPFETLPHGGTIFVDHVVTTAESSPGGIHVEPEVVSSIIH